MRWVAIIFAAAVATVWADVASAQSSTTTNCMMTCNAQAATCQSTCFVPAAPPLGSTTSPLLAAQLPGANTGASTTCVMSCTTTQVTCQTACARSASQGLQLAAPPPPPTTGN
jgi:hypothetical protein